MQKALTQMNIRLANVISDLIRIDGIDVGVAQTLISEVGLDMTRRKTEAHFASWLGLCAQRERAAGLVGAKVQ
jgi:transposase